MSSIHTIINEITSIPAASLPVSPFGDNGERYEFSFTRQDESFVNPFAFDLPSPVQEWWNLIQSATLFEDTIYGQWGLKLLSPSAAVSETKEAIETRPEDFRETDLIIGTFLGDSDLLVVNCAKGDAFGQVMIALPIDGRHDWYIVADTFPNFLSAYVQHNGKKFWEKGVNE